MVCSDSELIMKILIFLHKR